ncbi:unnamed protein product, partial [Rotaria sp. Silwood2]
GKKAVQHIRKPAWGLIK